MRMIRIGQDHVINAYEVSSMSWDHRTYVNGSGPSTLILRMRNGDTINVHHNPGMYDGVDAYAVEKQIVGACNDGPEN